MGFQVRRFVGATGEEDRWAYAPRDAGGEVSRYGELLGGTEWKTAHLVGRLATQIELLQQADAAHGRWLQAVTDQRKDGQRKVRAYRHEVEGWNFGSTGVRLDA